MLIISEKVIAKLMTIHTDFNKYNTVVEDLSVKSYHMNNIKTRWWTTLPFMSANNCNLYSVPFILSRTLFIFPHFK